MNLEHASSKYVVNMNAYIFLTYTVDRSLKVAGMVPSLWNPAFFFSCFQKGSGVDRDGRKAAEIGIGSGIGRGCLEHVWIYRSWLSRLEV